MTKKSALTESLSATGNWDDYINWTGDGKQFHPLFQGEIDPANIPTVLNDPQEPSTYLVSGCNDFEQPFNISSTSVAEETLSDYAFSAPPSIAGPSSFDQGQPWLIASPSITHPTSPLLDHGHQLYSVSYEASDGGLSPLRRSMASPFFETQSLGSSSSYQTAAFAPFNPNLSGSPHASFGFDMSELDSISNVGTWADGSIQSQNLNDDLCGSQGIAPIRENEGGIAAPFPQGSPSFSNTFAAHPWSLPSSREQQQPQQTRSRAVTIPRAQSRRAPPLLSVSPEATRHSKTLLSRSSSNRSEPRRKPRPATSSPTSNDFAWVSYQPSAYTNKLVPFADSSSGRRVKGRTGALSSEQRTSTAAVRRARACENCRKRKERCDLGIPCQSCLVHFKGDLVNHPCRDTKVSDLSRVFLSDRLGWHPTKRDINAFMAPYKYLVSESISYFIPLNFGFGPSLHLPVHAIEIEGQPELHHDHIIYSWPPTATSFRKDRNAILPAVLTREMQFTLPRILDSHLGFLVQQHFKEFPLYQSPLRILGEIYLLYLRLPNTSSYSRLLLQSLKLLVLVHIGGDITLPPPSTDSYLQLIIKTTMSCASNCDSDSDMPTPTPCFIRSQFGAIMPDLAHSLMREVLTSLEHMLLNRNPTEWPIVLATLLVILITVESIQYHAAKLPYHHSYDSCVSQQWQEHDNKTDDEGVKILLAFYSACFAGFHAKLGEHCEVGTRSENDMASGRPEDRFVAGLKEAIARVRPVGYLDEKATSRRVGDDMAFFFDRLAARLLVL